MVMSDFASKLYDGRPKCVSVPIGFAAVTWHWPDARQCGREHGRGGKPATQGWEWFRVASCGGFPPCPSPRSGRCKSESFRDAYILIDALSILVRSVSWLCYKCPKDHKKPGEVAQPRRLPRGPHWMYRTRWLEDGVVLGSRMLVHVTATPKDLPRNEAHEITSKCVLLYVNILLSCCMLCVWYV